MNASGENKGAADDVVNQISQALENNLPEADRLRARTLDDLQLLRTARAAGLKREHERLSELDPDHPRLAELAARHIHNEELIGGIALESERSRVDVPDVDKDTWVLHGIIRDQQLHGAPNVTVALYDASGNWLQQLGYSGTSANGYFRLEARNLANLKPPVFVHVLNAQGAHLHSDTVPLSPAAGSVLYHEVVISGTQSGTPPGESRNDPVADAGAWIVRGRVADKSGKGLGKLVVSLYDKDLFFDDRLGETTTDDSGEFSITYRTDDFRDLIEKKPDIYVKVLDQKGKTLFTSKKKLRYEAGRVEVVDVVLSDDKI